eukprot:XP_002932215.2 PREDICTED: complement factor H-like [Xenopus tropicalis]
MSAYKFCILLLCPSFCFAQGKSCDQPPDIENALVTVWKQQYKHGESAKYTCQAGYTISEDDQAKCDEGKWRNVPKCTSTSCESAPEIPNAVLMNKKNNYNSGDRAFFRCNTGYVFNMDQNSAICKNSQWKELPECRREGQSCGPPPVVQFGDTLQTRERTNKHGTVMTYKCPEYYILEGNREVVCRNGKWDDPPICIATSCESAPEIPNAVLMNKKNNYNSGDRAFFRCNTGYVFNMDQNSAICKNAQWKELPECRREGQSCGPPPVVQFGDTLQTRERTNKHGTKMTYKCPEYYILEGNREVVCRNGKWDDPPICIEPCTTSERDMKANNIQMKWIRDKKYYSRHNEWIGFSCLYGYEISDEKLLRIQCNRSVLPYPKCTKIGSCLLSLIAMDEKNIVVNGSTEIEDGKTANFLCKEGLIPIDTMTQVCNNKKINYPTCRSADSCQISQEQLDENGLELDSKDKASVYFEDREFIQFKCKTGLTIITGTVGLCAKTHITYPKCTNVEICRISQYQLDENGLELDSKDKASVFFEHGDLIQFKCKTGFAITTGTMGLCAKTQITYPRCTKI